MSVCFFVNSDQAGTSTEAEANETDGSAANEPVYTDSLQGRLNKFWSKVSDDIDKTTADDFKTQALPLARIKKIMKLDDEVKMISAEAPLLFAKAAEIFIHELTLRAWSHTEDNKRRTLQRNDIAMAISKSDQFDFLIDIVPRHETIVTKPKKETPPPRAVITTINQTQPSTSVQTGTSATQPQLVLQPYAQLIQTPQSSSAPAAAPATSQPMVIHQVMPNNEIQQVPLQLTQAQLNMIRFQMQNNPNQPIIIQAQPQQNQQIIQVSSQAQQPQQQVFLQVATSQETDS